jgi:hypothetical protein
VDRRRWRLTNDSNTKVVARLPCTVIVRGSNEESIAGIKFVVERATESVPEIAYVTDAQGSAHVGLPVGEATLRFFLPDGASQAVVVRVDREPGRTYTVKLPTGGRTSK